LGRELLALRLAAGENRRRVPELQIPETELREHGDRARDRRLIREKLDAVLDGRLEHVRDALVAIFDLERLLAVPRAFAGRARDLDVGQERELRRDRALARALFAAAAFDVEAECRGRVAAPLRLLGVREQLADRVVEAHVRRGIRAR